MGDLMTYYNVLSDSAEMQFFSVHNHDEFSNLRMKDSINKIEDMMDYAYELGYKGFAITNHECISSAVRGIKHYYDKYSDTDFKFALGNEIYLIPNNVDYYKENGGKYYHFILVAKNEKGWRQLRELSTQAWKNYFVKSVERVPIEMEQVKEIIGNEKGNLIASSACLGSYFAQLILSWIETEDNSYKMKIHNFINWCIDVFGKDDFYIELAPSLDEEQILYNKVAIKIANAYGLKYILATDSHYLRKEDRFIHSAFINSASDKSDNERDSFYLYSYMQSINEIYEHACGSMTTEEIDIALKNTMSIYDKVEMYDIRRPVHIPQISLPKFTLEHLFKQYYKDYPNIKKYSESKSQQDLYHLYLIEQGFREKNQEFDETNLLRINTELGILWDMSKKLNQDFSSYLNLMIDVLEEAWKYSYVGVGRGSVGGWYCAYLLDIIHINPIQYDLKEWRFLNPEKVSLPDIDIDFQPSQRPKIVKGLKKKLGERNVIHTATVRKEGSRSSVLTSCRGLGINNDVADSIAGMIQIDRGTQWSLHDMLYGNEEEGRKPQKEFINAIREYPNLEETMLKLEGLVSGRSIHASAVYLFLEENGYLDNGLAMMKSKNKEEVTCSTMYDVDAVGGLKLDLLVIDALDKLRKAMELLETDGLIEKGLTLREQYNKYLHPDVLEYDDPKMWEKLYNGEILDVFQFQTDLAIQALKKTKVTSIEEMAQINTLMRLSSEDGEQPMDTFVRFKADISLWYDEMREFGLNETEIGIMEEHLLELKGICDTQEALMTISMDNRISNFTMTEADNLRKILGKKLTDQIAGARKHFLEKGLQNGTTDIFLKYVWDVQFKRLMKYSFNKAHTTEYSVIGLQEMNIYHKFNPIYWNTSVLICNSGSVDETEDGSTDYGKVAVALDSVIQRGVNVVLPNVNYSEYSFKPDAQNNQIYYGLFAISGLNRNIVNHIIENRPYTSLDDFIDKTEDILKNQHYLTLIKSGSLNSLIKSEDNDRSVEGRIDLMRQYLEKTMDLNSKIDGRQVLTLLKAGLTPFKNTIQERYLKYRQYIFSPQFETKTEYTTPNKKFYKLNDISIDFFEKEFIDYCEEGKQYFYDTTGIIVNKNSFDTIYKKRAKEIVEWTRTQEALDMYNSFKTQEKLDSVFTSIPQWEIESLNYYYTKHIMDGCNIDNHLIQDFFKMDNEPKIKERRISKKGYAYNTYFSHRIAGTVVHSDKDKKLVYLLTPTGVVPIKYYKGAFEHYRKQISEIQEDGTKKVLSKSWFARHTHLVVEGYRRGDQFIAYVDKKSGEGHTTMRVVDIIPEAEYPLRIEFERPKAS
jgi:DNA polymerase-3 subunit alpha